MAILLIVVLGCLMLIPGTWQLPLLDRDEPRFAQATVEMMDRDELVIPTFNGDYRFDKPILTYWLMRAGYTLFGVNEMGARWHSVVATLLIALSLYATGRRWFSEGVGLWAAIAFLTCFQIVLNGRSCVADMPMVLAVVIAQVALFELINVPDDDLSLPWAILFYTFLGLGFLAKGPIAILVPAITLALFRGLLWRKALPWKRFRPHYGLPLLLIIIGSWGIPAMLRTGGLFWDVGINDNVVRRGVEVFHSRFYSPFFYLGTAFISLFPWISMAGQGWQALRSQWQAQNAFLCAWVLSLYVIFSFYATQLPHYVMPAFPAFFLILAQALHRPVSATRGTRWWSGFIIVGASIWTVVLCTLLFVTFKEGAPSGIILIIAGALAMQTGFMLVIFTYRRSKGFLWVAFVMISAGPLLLGYGLRPMHPAAILAPTFKKMPPESAFLGSGFQEGTLVFYSHRRWELTNSRPRLDAFLAKPGPRMVVLLETEIKLDRLIKWKLNQYLGNRGLLEMNDYRPELKSLALDGYDAQHISGLNLGRFSWVTLKIITRCAPIQAPENVYPPHSS